MDPFTWVVLAMLAGTTATAYGQYQAGQSQKKLAEYNAALAKREADIEADRFKREKVTLASRMRAGYGAAGVQMSGTPLEVMDQTAKDIESDIALTRWKGDVEAGLYRYKGRVAGRSGTWKAGTTLLTGGTKAGAAYFGTKGKTPQTRLAPGGLRSYRLFQESQTGPYKKW